MILFAVSYIGGVLTILSPCILPVLPFVFARANQPFIKSGLPLLLGMALTFAVVASLAAVGGGWVVATNEAHGKKRRWTERGKRQAIGTCGIRCPEAIQYDRAFPSVLKSRELPREHGARQDLRSGRHCSRLGKRPACRICRRRLVSPAGAQGSSLEDDAASWHDATHLWNLPLSAQTRYAAGTREILECWFEGRPIRDEYLIVDGGKLAGTGAHSYSAGNATAGSEEAAKFKSAR